MNKHIPSSGELYATIETVQDTVEAGSHRDEIIKMVRETIDVVQDLEAALKSMQERAYWVRSAVQRIDRADINESISGLGELQGAGPSLDVACAVFDERQKAARKAMARLEKLTGLGAEL